MHEKPPISHRYRVELFHVRRNDYPNCRTVFVTETWCNWNRHCSGKVHFTEHSRNKVWPNSFNQSWSLRDIFAHRDMYVIAAQCGTTYTIVPLKWSVEYVCRWGKLDLKRFLFLAFTIQCSCRNAGKAQVFVVRETCFPDDLRFSSQVLPTILRSMATYRNETLISSRSPFLPFQHRSIHVSPIYDIWL